jgi:hypothetical protein
MLPLAEQLNCPKIEIWYDDDPNWGYSLFMGADCLHEFCVAPEYLYAGADDADEEKEIAASYKGNPQELAHVWDISLPTIANYLISWDRLENPDDKTFNSKILGRGKAYSDDQAEYGDPWQMLDFARKLGFKGKEENFILQELFRRRSGPRNPGPSIN